MAIATNIKTDTGTTTKKVTTETVNPLTGATATGAVGTIPSPFDGAKAGSPNMFTGADAGAQVGVGSTNVSTVNPTPSGDMAGGAGRAFPAQPGIIPGSTIPDTTKIEDTDPDKTQQTMENAAAIDGSQLGIAGQTAKQKTEDARLASQTTQPTGTGSTGGGTGTIGTGGGDMTTMPVGKNVAVGEVAPWQEYFDKAVNTEFSYNPAEDNEYRLAASQLEQQVTDMMVGRGGLYSSVAQSALQSRLMSLQVEYQKIAYDKFKEERDFNMQLASFVADREDKEWDKNFKMAQFKAELEQQKFDNNIKSAQLRMQQASANASRQLAQARAKQAEQQTALAFEQADLQKDYYTAVQLIDKWKNQNGGVADYEIASFFGNVRPGDSYMQKGVIASTTLNLLENRAQALANEAKANNDIDSYLNIINGFQQESQPQTIDYDSNYSSVYTDVLQAHQAGTSYNDILSAVLSESSGYKSSLGTSNYNKLISDLNSKASSED